MVLGLQKLELVLDPVAGLRHCELEARLAWLVRSLKGQRSQVLVTQVDHLSRSPSAKEDRGNPPSSPRRCAPPTPKHGGFSGLTGGSEVLSELLSQPDQPDQHGLPAVS